MNLHDLLKNAGFTAHKEGSAYRIITPTEDAMNIFVRKTTGGGIS